MQRTLSTLFFVTALGAASAASPVSETVFLGGGVSSLGTSEFGIGFQVPTPGKFMEYSRAETPFYLKGKLLSAFFVHDEHGAPSVPSLDLLFPGIVFGMILFEKDPQFKSLWTWFFLLNGELGYRGQGFEIGLINGLHPFADRAPYHEAGVRLGLGKKNRVGFTLYEQDRFAFPTTMGFKMDVQFHDAE